MVLPAAFPNLLANGAQGIAVGMATSIPPHNVAELCDAALHLIDKPDARAESLLKYVPGPDFPTGGVIVDPRNEIAEAYATGRGSFRVRARWTQEDTGRGTWLVVVTEIPWLVQKSRLVERIAELLNEKKLPLVADVRDEFAEDIRLVIEPRARTVDPALMMESLFKLTELESRISLNMNVLVKGKVPRVIGLAEALARMARPSPRRAAAPLEPPAEADRAPARSARRLPDRVSQHRQGHQDHPQRGRAEARPDEDLQAHRRAGGSDPQHAAAQSAQARGVRDPQGGQGAARREEIARRAARLGEEAVGDDRRRRSGS